MKKLILIIAVGTSFVTTSLVLTSCKKNPGQVRPIGGQNNPPAITKCPVAKAGADTTIMLPQGYLNLNGSGSYDSLNRTLSFEWQLIGGLQPISMDSYAPRPFVSGFKEGNYSFQLKVTAGSCSTYDTVKVTVLPATYCQQNREEVPVQLNPLVALPAYVQSPRIFAVPNKLIVMPMYMFTYPNVYIYDQLTLQWTSTQISNIREGMSIIAAGTKIYFAGGMIYDNNYNVITSTQVDIYDLTTGTWTVSNLSESRAFAKAIEFENKLFFAGGMKSDRTFSNKMDIYNVSANSWSAASFPGTARTINGATAAQNKLFFCGGYTEFADYSGFGETFNKAVRDIDIYNVASGAWAIDSMPVAKQSFATFSFNNKLYLAGGIMDGNQDSYPETLDFTVEIKDVNSSVTSLACLFQPNTFGSLDVIEKNGQVVFMGDNSFTSTISGKIDIYNTQNGTWKIGLLPFNMLLDAYQASVVAINNQIYVVYEGNIYTMNF
jgi:hypothetical protein